MPMVEHGFSAFSLFCNRIIIFFLQETENLWHEKDSYISSSLSNSSSMHQTGSEGSIDKVFFNYIFFP